MSDWMKAYKGFDKDMKCRSFQFEEGATYHEDTAKLCERGFHACTMPLDVLKYYAPADGSVYREVELDGVADEKSDDSKICAKSIKVGAEIGIAEIVKAQIEWVKSEIGFDKAVKNASATGYHGAASATGKQSAASATGKQSAASVTGDWSAASATGYHGAASATGDWSAASATGNWSAASATGDWSAASVTGDWSAASATGYHGAASATGDWSAASATGNWSAASATGYHGAASVTGDWSAASATGYHGAASATGKACCAIATGIDGKVMGTLGNAIFGVERGEYDKTLKIYPIISVASAIVDGESVKENVWYIVKNGRFVEVQKDEE